MDGVVLCLSAPETEENRRLPPTPARIPLLWDQGKEAANETLALLTLNPDSWLPLSVCARVCVWGGGGGARAAHTRTAFLFSASLTSLWI